MIFLWQKREDPKKGIGYFIDRDEDKYTYIEGDVDIFNKIAFENLERGKNSPYDTMVLSFEEEDMTMEEIFEIYNDWKEMYLGSYDEDELYLTSVIHWDDEHPHIHITAIRHSMINGKELRMTRPGKDNKLFGRNDAIQEVLNYKYGLTSPHDKLNLYPTTPEQKKRDWNVKKGKDYEEVEDDKYYDIMRMATVKSNNFTEFMAILEARFEVIELKQIYNDERVCKIDGKRFNSALFNEEFYNKHIKEIKAAEEVFKGDRKSEQFYKDLWKEKDFEHRTHLEDRNIHEGLQEVKINNGDLEFLATALDIDKEFKKIRELQSINLGNKKDQKKLEVNIKDISEFLFCKEDIELYLKELGIKISSYYDQSSDKGILKLEKDNKIYELKNERLYENLQKNKNDSSHLKDLEANRLNQIKAKMGKMVLSKRDNIELIRGMIINEVFEAAISSEEDLNKLFEELEIKKVNEGYSISKGGYITLQYKKKKFALYDDYIYDLYNKKDIELDEDIEEENGIIKSILMDEQGLMKPESVLEYKLNNSKEIDFSITNQGGEEYDFTEVQRQRDRKSYDRIDDNTDSLLLRRSLNLDKSVIKMINSVKHKDWKHIRLSGTDIEYQRETVKTLLILSKENISENTCLKDLKIDCDLYEKSIHIKDGFIYEIEEMDFLDVIEEETIKDKNEDIIIKDGVKLVKSEEDISTVSIKRESSSMLRI